MYVYTGSNPVIREMIELVNRHNAAGQIVKMRAYFANRFTEAFSPTYQQLNIVSMQTPIKSKSIRERYKTPIPKRKKGEPTFAQLKRQGVIKCTEYRSTDILSKITFEPKTGKPLATWDTDARYAAFYVNGSVVFAGTIVSSKYNYSDGGTLGYTKVDEKDLQGNELPLTYYSKEKHPSASFGYPAEPEFGKLSIVDPELPQNFEFPKFPPIVVREYREQPKALTAAFAKRNSSATDALTQLFEAKESILGLQSNVMRTVQWFLDLRKRHTLVSKSVITEAEFRAARRKAMSGNWIDVRSAKAHKRDLRKAKQDLVRYERKLSKKYGSPIGENGPDWKSLTDRFTGHWLDSIYGIGATTLSVVDLLEVLDNQRPIYVRGKAPFAYEVDLPNESQGWTLSSGGVKVSGKAFAKGRVAISGLNDIGRYTRFNPLLTAWEKVPLSFVVDWFLSIGDLLASLSPDIQWEQEVTQCAYKHDIDITYKLETEAGTFTLNISGYEYSRVFVSPDSRFLSLFSTPDFSGFLGHGLTAFSLLWARLRGNKLSRTILNG